MSLTHPVISTEAIEAAIAIGRAHPGPSPEQKQLVADLLTPFLERWAAEQVPVKRKAAA